MTAVVLGLIAAVAWGVHDFIARLVGRAFGGIQSTLAVLCFGAVALAGSFLLIGKPISAAYDVKELIAGAGIAYAIAFYWLFLAYANGPVSLVTPIIAAYPVFAMAWAVATGATPGLIKWAAAFGIVTGVALVARFAPEPPHDPADIVTPSRNKAVLFSVLSGLGFSVSFLAGQTAAAQVDPVTVAFLSRICSLAVVAPMWMRSVPEANSIRPWLWLIAAMGVLDALALSAVVAAGQLPDAPIAQVVASSLGVVTVLLAVVFLRERLCWPQLGGMALVFAGVAALSGGG